MLKKTSQYHLIYAILALGIGCSACNSEPQQYEGWLKYDSKACVNSGGIYDSHDANREKSTCECNDKSGVVCYESWLCDQDNNSCKECKAGESTCFNGVIRTCMQGHWTDGEKCESGKCNKDNTACMAESLCETKCENNILTTCSNNDEQEDKFNQIKTQCPYGCDGKRCKSCDESYKCDNNTLTRCGVKIVECKNGCDNVNGTDVCIPDKTIPGWDEKCQPNESKCIKTDSGAKQYQCVEGHWSEVLGIECKGCSADATVCTHCTENKCDGDKLKKCQGGKYEEVAKPKPECSCQDGAWNCPGECPADCPNDCTDGVCNTHSDECPADCPNDCTDGVCNTHSDECPADCPNDCTNGVCNTHSDECPADCPNDCTNGVCNEKKEICDNEMDDDKDGKIDCEDEDCGEDAICLNNTEPELGELCKEGDSTVCYKEGILECKLLEKGEWRWQYAKCTPRICGLKNGEFDCIDKQNPVEPCTEGDKKCESGPKICAEGEWGENNNADIIDIQICDSCDNGSDLAGCKTIGNQDYYYECFDGKYTYKICTNGCGDGGTCNNEPITPVDDKCKEYAPDSITVLGGEHNGAGCDVCIGNTLVSATVASTGSNCSDDFNDCFNLDKNEFLDSCTIRSDEKAGLDGCYKYGEHSLKLTNSGDEYSVEVCTNGCNDAKNACNTSLNAQKCDEHSYFCDNHVLKCHSGDQIIMVGGGMVSSEYLKYLEYCLKKDDGGYSCIKNESSDNGKELKEVCHPVGVENFCHDGKICIYDNDGLKCYLCDTCTSDSDWMFIDPNKCCDINQYPQCNTESNHQGEQLICQDGMIKSEPCGTNGICEKVSGQCTLSTHVGGGVCINEYYKCDGGTKRCNGGKWDDYKGAWVLSYKYDGDKTIEFYICNTADPSSFSASGDSCGDECGQFDRSIKNKTSTSIHISQELPSSITKKKICFDSVYDVSLKYGSNNPFVMQYVNNENKLVFSYCEKGCNNTHTDCNPASP